MVELTRCKLLKNNLSEHLSKSNLKASEYKDTGVGKIMVIVANGPTHKKADLNRLVDVKKVDILMINKPDERIWPSDFWLFCDPAILSTHRRYWEEYHGTIINTRQVAETKANCLTLQTIPDITFSTDIGEGVHIGRTSTYVALQVAMYMNYKYIYIFGCDMGRVDGDLYTWGENPNAPSELREKRFKNEAKSFQYFVDNAAPNELERVFFCSLENNWPFMKSVNKIAHNKAVDEIIRRCCTDL